MSVLSSISIGSKALQAASAGIEVTSQNVGNATTVGYSRKTLHTRQSDPLLKGGLLYGSGVDLAGITRATDRLLGMRVVAAAGDASAAQTRLESLKVSESWFNESTATGLAEAWDGLFDALSALTTDPSDPSLRRGVTSAGNTLALTISRTATGLQQTVDSVDASLQDQVDEVNDMLVEVAGLNAAIGRGGAAAGATDLLDRRDQLVRELGEAIGATVEFAADGQATVFIGGHAVVSGPAARTVAIDTDATTGAPILTVSVDNGEVPVNDDIAGTIGGALSARNTTQGWLDDLDTFAYDLATTLNAAHAAGFDANGAAGGAFFVAPTAVSGCAATFAMDPSLLDDPDLFAAAGSAAADPGDATNLVALLDYEGADNFSGSTQTGLEAVSDLLSRVGSDVAAADADATNTDSVLQDLDAMRESISGVDTDEEAIRLIEYQAAYRAAAQVISAANEMLGSLFAMGG